MWDEVESQPAFRHPDLYGLLKTWWCQAFIRCQTPMENAVPHESQGVTRMLEENQSSESILMPLKLSVLMGHFFSLSSDQGRAFLDTAEEAI